MQIKKMTVSAAVVAALCTKGAATTANAVAGRRDWPEDFPHENGKYMCNCTTCGHSFMGYKRRVTCKLCAATPPSDGEK